MRHADRIALLLSLLAVLAGIWVADRIYERLAHLEDEMAYVWQAQVIARGHLTTPVPPGERSFLVPFVVDYEGLRFGKYPLGWPVLLSFGVRAGARHLVNPLLGGLAVWLTYLLVRRTLGRPAALLAAGLTVVSPFFLMNTGSLLSHPWGLVLSAAFALSWLDAFDQRQPESGAPGWRRWLPTISAGACLGMMALTRPLTALLVGLPFGLHGLFLLTRGDWSTRRRVLLVGLLAGAIAALLFAWQYAVTGDPWLNPYTLWWEYDKVGFGPGYGVTQAGHNLDQARVNTDFSLWVGNRDLFGWGAYSWLFIPFGVWAIRRNRPALLVSSVFPVLVIGYMAYWIGSWIVGPRYYFEGLYSLTLLSAAGIAWLAGWPLSETTDAPPNTVTKNPSRWLRLRRLGMTAILALLISGNLIFYLPMRMNMLIGLYDVQHVHLEPFLTPSAQKLPPALIVVHVTGKWIQYGRLIELSDPLLDSPFIIIFSRGPEIDAEVIQHFPDRAVYHYYPDTPYRFYLEAER
jgi:hypothetical protein